MEPNAILSESLSLSSDIPLYAQLVGIIKRSISSGALAIGDLLPSEAELCRALNVSRNTVRQAIGELEDEGLVVRKRGKGTFVADPNTNQRRRHRRRKPQPPPEGIEGHGQKGQKVRQRINADLQHPIQRRHQSTPSFRSRSKRKAEYASCTSRNLRRLMGRRVPSFSRNTSSCRPATSWKFTTTPRQMPQKHG